MVTLEGFVHKLKTSTTSFRFIILQRNKQHEQTIELQTWAETDLLHFSET